MIIRGFTCCERRTRTFTRRLAIVQVNLVVNPSYAETKLILRLFLDPHPRDKGAWLPTFITSQY